MKLLEEIKEHFASRQEGIRIISSLPALYKAYTIRNSEYYGVAVAFHKINDISESSVESRIFTTVLSVEGHAQKYLLLCCFNEQFRLPFAQLCEHFVEPGDNGENRLEILNDTLTWWDKWIGLLGNCKTDRQAYSFIAEMLALKSIYKYDKSAKWTAANLGSHDIETDKKSVEVKATICKSSTKITIHSQFQLSSEKELNLLFYRLEESEHGISINDVKKQLIQEGYDEFLLESQLKQFNLLNGSSIRNQKFVVLETRRYIVDDTFPKITKESFKNNVFPKNINKIEYQIDLEGIDYTSLQSFKNEEYTISDATIEEINNASEIKHNPDIDTSYSAEIPIFSDYKIGRIPLYSMRAACGSFVEREDPIKLGWVDASGHGFTPDPKRHFVVQAEGNSMSTLIKDGDLCVFEWYNKAGGTREGNIVLMYAEDKLSDGSTYTIKEYHSEKKTEEDSWRHEKIILKPLNKDYDPIVLEEGQKVYTIGIFKCVL